MNITFFEQTAAQKIVSAFGRKMMWASESGEYMNIPLPILNSFSDVGEHLAETASMKGLSEAQLMTVRYAKKLIG